ncbi:hypothetical protein ACULN0_01965 [Pectobacterium actinidiae]|uniref:hypothetical protein n=1 Tax=Pectobacterium actinidiae TaxID=1507808 RepID=UPI0040408526
MVNSGLFIIVEVYGLLHKKTNNEKDKDTPVFLIFNTTTGAYINNYYLDISEAFKRYDSEITILEKKQNKRERTKKQRPGSRTIFIVEANLTNGICINKNHLLNNKVANNLNIFIEKFILENDEGLVLKNKLSNEIKRK